jgi:hypothetical protein
MSDKKTAEDEANRADKADTRMPELSSDQRRAIDQGMLSPEEIGRARQSAHDAERRADLDRKIEDAAYEGWKVAERREYSARLIRRQYGSGLMHVVLLAVSFGLLNVPYLLYKYFFDAEKRVVRV